MSIASRAKQKANDPTDKEKRRDYWAAKRSGKITLRTLQPFISAMFMSALHRRREAKVLLIDDTHRQDHIVRALDQRKLPLP